MVATESKSTSILADTKPGDTALWESFDQAGWHALESYYHGKPPGQSLARASGMLETCGETMDSLACGSGLTEEERWKQWQEKQRELLVVAKNRFTKALRFAGSSPIRQGRSQIGLTWTNYLESLRTRPTEPKTTQASRVSGLINAANESIKKLSQQDLIARDRECLAKGHQLLGLLYLESCNGIKATEHLDQARSLFEQLRILDRLYDVLHLLGKLAQCKQKFSDAINLFLRVEQATDPERRTRAFLARMTAMLWIGRIREAWQNYRQWVNLSRTLPSLAHADLILRGQMLFALIGTRYGALKQARDILSDIEKRFECKPIEPSFCTAVLALIRAEYFVEMGDIPSAIECLDCIAWDRPLTRKGYDCFEILFLGSACRQCITSCWVCERWCCDPCGNCTSELVVFQGDTQSVPIDIQRMLCCMADGQKAKICYANGDLCLAEKKLTEICDSIRTIFPSDSSIDVPYRIALLKVVQVRDNDAARIQNCVNELLAYLTDWGKVHGRRFDYESDVERALGLWRSELSENDIAKTILEGALRKSLAARDAKHPEVLALRSEIIQVSSELTAKNLDALYKEVQETIDIFETVVDCLDYRKLAAMRVAAWIVLLKGCFEHAIRLFFCLEQLWMKMQERNGAGVQIEDSRVTFGRVAAKLEAGVDGVIVTDLLHRGIQRIVANSSLDALAHDLNRLALLLFWNGRLRSAYFFARKSLDQYESMGNAMAAKTVRETVHAIEIEAEKKQVLLHDLVGH